MPAVAWVRRCRRLSICSLSVTDFALTWSRACRHGSAGTAPGSEFRAVSYRSQIVNGKNYFVKIDVGSGGYLLACIYEPPASMASRPELASLKETTEDAPISYF